jgi:hypothetical protein
MVFSSAVVDETCPAGELYGKREERSNKISKER